MNVYKHGQHIPNSPFKITVGESEIGNASKVKAYGPGLEHGMANEYNDFIVDTKDAGVYLHSNQCPVKGSLFLIIVNVAV